MQLLRKRWLSGLLLTAPLLALIPSLTLVRGGDAAPPPPSTHAIARELPAPAPTAAPPIARLAPPQPPAPTPGLRAPLEPPYTPILMYHYIRNVDEAADPLGFRLSVQPDRFAEQMAWLKAHGYETVLMRDLAACLRGERRCPPQAVALTFDDGYADNATAALPTLRRYGFRATFYVVAGFIGRDGYLSWEQLELLRDSGMEIGAHTVSHVDLAALELAEAQAEIERSRATLERRLGIKVVSFSYPAGSYTPAVARAVRAAGFTSAVTAGPGESMRRLYELPRRRVLGGETIAGYPWYFLPMTSASGDER